MKTLITAMVIGLALSVQAHTWTATNAPVTVTIDGLRVEFIGLTISTNLTAGGIVAVSKMSGSNVISRHTLPLSPKTVTEILKNCGGITLQQLGNLILVAGGGTVGAEFITRVEVFVDSKTSKARLTIATASGKKQTLDEAVVNAAMVKAGGSVSIFQKAFLDFAGNKLK